MPSVDDSRVPQQVVVHLFVEFGEGASSILREFLNLREPSQPDTGATEAATAKMDGDVDVTRTQSLLNFVNSPVYRGQRNVTEKFLALLEFLHKQHQSEFEKVLGLRGRRRNYFGRSEPEIRQSGMHTYPRKIPHSEYWVLTNASNHHKREIVRRALQQLGYSSNVRSTVADALE